MAVTDAKPPLSRHELPGPDADLSHKREIARRLDSVIKGGAVEWISEVTLATGATSTTVTDERVSTDSQISLHPLTAEAAALLPVCWIGAADLEPGTPWGATQVGRFTIRHPNLAGGVVATFRCCTKG